MPKLDLMELGLTGLERFGGWIYEEFLRALQGSKAVEVYKEMESNDPVIGAMLFAIKMLIRQASWEVVPGGTDTTDEETVEFLKSCLDDMSMSWSEIINECLSMLTYGYSTHEIVYKVRGGQSNDPTLNSKFDDRRIGWRKLPIRSQDTLDEWDFDDAGGFRGFYQVSPPTYRRTYIPIEKTLLFRIEHFKGNPEGRSVLRNAYRPWFFKKRIEEIEGVGIERDLAGLPVIWAPQELFSASATAEQKQLMDTFKKLVTRIRRDEQEGIVFPLAHDDRGNKLFDLTLLTTGGRRQIDTGAIVERYNRMIAMTTMADFILLGHEKVGSFALSSSKTDLFATALGAFLDSIEDVFNRYAIPRLFSLNQFNLKKHPTLSHGDIETPDLGELGDYISKLSGAGIDLTGDEELENYLRTTGGMPRRPIE